MPTTPPYTPHAVRLMGHRNLGTVKARWLGCILELEDGTRYGPCAVFDAVPVEPHAVEPDKPVGLLKGWKQCPSGKWSLRSSDGLSVALVGELGADVGDEHLGDMTGLSGKAWAVGKLLDAGWAWVSEQAQKDYLVHDSTFAVGEFGPHDVAVMVDGTRRAVRSVVGSCILFTGGAWIEREAACKQIAARIPADDDIPF